MPCKIDGNTYFDLQENHKYSISVDFLVFRVTHLKSKSTEYIHDDSIFTHPEGWGVKYPSTLSFTHDNLSKEWNSYEIRLFYCYNKHCFGFNLSLNFEFSRNVTNEIAACRIIMLLCHNNNKRFVSETFWPKSYCAVRFFLFIFFRK